jgi:dethiobiotin synthetase
VAASEGDRPDTTPEVAGGTDADPTSGPNNSSANPDAALTAGSVAPSTGEDITSGPLSSVRADSSPGESASAAQARMPMSDMPGSSAVAVGAAASERPDGPLADFPAVDHLSASEGGPAAAPPWRVERAATDVTLTSAVTAAGNFATAESRKVATADSAVNADGNTAVAEENTSAEFGRSTAAEDNAPAQSGRGAAAEGQVPRGAAAEDQVARGAAAGEARGEQAARSADPVAQPAPRRPEAGEWRGIVLVTGTDTDVGKTIVTAAIAASAQASGLRVAVIKPGQTGTITGAPTDIDLINRLAEPHTARTLASFPEPLAPLAAAKVANMAPLELYEVVDAIRAEAARHDLVLVEGAGGLLVPMGVRPSGEPWTLADLATTLGVSTVVVSRAGLGTLNHTALTLEALARRGVPVGVVLGAWPTEPELVHWANLSEMLPHLVGALPDGAGAMDPGVFRRSAPGWLAPALYGVLDDWRVWAEEVS